MFKRDIVDVIADRIKEPRRYMQVVAGPRQTGKTTVIKQALAQSGATSHVASADGLSIRGGDWVELQWMQARRLCADGADAVLVLDEIQKVPQWSEVVKRLWDEDTWNDVPLKVVLSGSSSLLLKKGLTESLAGRFEVVRSTHWSLAEMRDAFGYGLDEFLEFGGYPGAAPLRGDRDRWLTYMSDSIVEAAISKDVLLMEDVRKPAVLRALFELGVQYSGQEMSYRKLLGQLDDKGNTATIAHYLTLLGDAGMLCGLPKYDHRQVASRKGSPRLLAYDPSLMTVAWEGSGSLAEDPGARGHLVETAVGAALLARSQQERFKLYWWRDGAFEVDFVAAKGDALVAIEVKSGKVGSLKGLAEFRRRHPSAEPMVVGEGGVALEDFLARKTRLF